jgi:surface carbohydrate biosynthesis protein
VLIIDDAGSQYIVHCIPEFCNYKIVKNRECIPYVNSVSFFALLVKYIVIFGIGSKALYSAIIDELQPKIVITFTDNNSFFGTLYSSFPEKKIISVQNGIRTSNINCIGVSRDCYQFGDYYTFGSFEKDIYTHMGGSFENYYDVGSLKLGLFLSKYKEVLCSERNKKTISFVSQYRKSLTIGNNKHNCKIIETIKEIYKLTVLWSINKGYSVSVLMANEKISSDYESELRFFKEVLTNENVEYCNNVKSRMTSYKEAMSSCLIIGLDSTLLLEMFGCNNKVIWGVSSDADLIKDRGLVKYKEILPKEVMLYNLRKKSFNEKVDNLISMNQDEYIELTESARKYLMNIGVPYPHEIISKDIERYLT